MADDDDLSNLVWNFALENAVRYGGKVNVKAVMGKILGQYSEYRSQSATVRELVDVISPQVELMTPEEQQQKLLEVNPEYKPPEKKRGPEKKVLPDLPM